MNDVQNLIDRQLGLPCRYGYDSVLRRLVVREADSYHGLGAPGVDDPPIFACRFAEANGHEHILALANEDGRVAIQDTSKINSDSSLESFQCHNNAVFDLAWMPSHMNFVTVSGDHTACLWSLSDGAARRAGVFAAHTRSVKCCVFPPDAPAPFATGARDGHVLVWDPRASSAVAVLRADNALLGCHSSAAPRTPASHGKRARLDTPRPVSITGLAFQDERTLLSCGECDGNIKVWDLRKNYSAYTREPLPKHSIPYCGSSTRNGYTSLVVDASRVRLYASCMDNVIYCFNVAAYCSRPERRYVGHENATFYIKTSLSPDGRYLVSGSSDKHAYIWNVGASHPVAKLVGHRAEVTCAAWARATVPALVTCSDDARHMVWRVGGELAEDGELRGRAEVVPRLESGPQDTERTPATRKRHNTPTPASSSKRPRLESSRRTKRCLADLLNAGRDSDETTAKRVRGSSPAPIDPPLQSAGCKRPCPPAEADSPKRACLEEAERRGGFTTPTKNSNNRSPLSPRSPNTLSKSPGAVVRAFLSELPDFAVDGEAPHLRLMSPGKRKTEGPDWLTRLVLEKRARVEPPFSTPAPLVAPASPKENAPPRRGSVSERTPKLAAKSTLLKYFTVAPREKKV